MNHPELIQPGDRVFLAVPVNLNHPPEEFAVELDEAYPGVDFEVFECSDGVTAQARPEIIFTYRDPRALKAWLHEQRVDTAEHGVGLTVYPGPLMPLDR